MYLQIHGYTSLSLPASNANLLFNIELAYDDLSLPVEFQVLQPVSLPVSHAKWTERKYSVWTKKLHV